MSPLPSPPPRRVGYSFSHYSKKVICSRVINLEIVMRHSPPSCISVNNGAAFPLGCFFSPCLFFFLFPGGPFFIADALAPLLAPLFENVHLDLVVAETSMSFCLLKDRRLLRAVFFWAFLPFFPQDRTDLLRSLRFKLFCVSGSGDSTWQEWIRGRPRTFIFFQTPVGCLSPLSFGERKVPS